jgi:secreted trypsin-like serine protease
MPARRGFARGATGWIAAALLGAQLLGIPASASATGAHASIVGGYPVSIESLPSLAYVETENASESTSCTGTVVAPRVILTAGHCVENLETGTVRPAAEYGVATGVSDWRAATANDVFPVTQAIVYPGFSPGQMHGDAGLLVLSRPTSAPSIRMATSSDLGLLAAGTPIGIAGWGKTSGEAEYASPLLRAAETVVQQPSYCRRAVGSYYPFFSSQGQFCAINPPSFSTATCHGDSGGPAIALDASGNPVELGITSLGEPECSTYEPNVFTRVDRISSWVAGWIAAVEEGAPAPAVSTPKVVLPFMSIGRARGLVARSLSEGLGSRWRSGRSKRMGCARVDRQKVKCGVSWWQGPNDYWGGATVYFLQQHGVVYWNDRYKIHSVNDHCWWYSGHRQSCRIRTFRR